jgi:hypothetical protein
MTPEMVHYGKAEQVRNQRQVVLASAFDTHPERFVRGIPIPPPLPEAAWINKPKVESKEAVIGENIPIPGVLGYGSEGDRRSWGFTEDDFFAQAVQLPGNDTKFESEVSQSR